MTTETINNKYDITYSMPEREGGRDYVCDVRVWHRKENRVMGVYRGEAPRKPTAERIAREKAIAAIHADRFESTDDSDTKMPAVSVADLSQYVRTSVVIDELYRTAERAGFHADQCAYPFERLVALAALAGVTSTARLDELTKDHASKIGELLRRMHELHNPKDGLWRVQKAFMAELIVIYAGRYIINLNQLLEVGWASVPAKNVLNAIASVSAH